MTRLGPLSGGPKDGKSEVEADVKAVVDPLDRGVGDRDHVVADVGAEREDRHELEVEGEADVEPSARFTAREAEACVAEDLRLNHAPEAEPTAADDAPHVGRGRDAGAHQVGVAATD